MAESDLPPCRISRRSVLLGSGSALVAGSLGRPGIARAATGPLTPFFGELAGAGLTWAHGLNLALSGSNAAVGPAMSRGATVAVDLIGASGGANIVLKLNDHQSGLVPASVTGVRRLIAQEHIGSLGTSFGAATEALFPLVERSGIITFWSGGAGQSGLGKPNVWLTMALFAVDPTPGGLAYMVKQNPTAKKLAILGQEENGIAAVNEIAPRVWTKLTGGEVVMKEMLNVGTTDFSSVVARLKSSGADVIFTTTFGNDEGYLIKQIREAGIEQPMLLIDLVTPTVPDIAGDAVAQNTFVAVDGYQVDNPNPYNKAFVEAYRKRYKSDPDYFAANFFEATNILAALISRVIKSGKKPERGTLLSDAVAENPKFPSVFGGTATAAGAMTFDLKTHAVVKPLGVYKVGKGGALTKVATIEANSTDVGPA